MDYNRLKKVIKINTGMFLLFILYYLFNHYTGIYIPCIFYTITGLRCPGCGITHCLFELVHFHFKEAFNYNQLVFIYLPFIVCYYFYKTYLYLYHRKDQILVKIPNYLRIGILVLTILFGILRNIFNF